MQGSYLLTDGFFSLPRLIFARGRESPFSRKGAGVLKTVIASLLARPRNPGSLGGVLAVGFADTAGLTEASLYFYAAKKQRGIFFAGRRNL